jgi:hypothetical protein
MAASCWLLLYDLYYDAWNHEHQVLYVCLFVQLCTAAYCAILVRRSKFCYQASPRESTQQQKVELRARNVW